MDKIAVFWFRRDLRIIDNHGLFKALTSGLPVLPVFIFDTEILGKLHVKTDARVNFIHAEIAKIKIEIEKTGSALKVLHAKPVEAFEQLTATFKIAAVYTNRDFEPYGIERDREVQTFLQKEGIDFHTFADHVVFEPGRILKDDGMPYTVFTPYSRKWKQALEKNPVIEYPSEKYFSGFMKMLPFRFPEIEELGFVKNSFHINSKEIDETIILNYTKTRDFPAVHGTSRLGVHLRFGTVSIRKVTNLALGLSEVFLNELIWRNFFIDILWHFPQVATRAFKPKYDFVPWRNNEVEFALWCLGETGYPMVDAGMRELNETGFMHNRVRMVTASFLTKHLLIDWRWGEAYFAEKLLDFELASNNGNWQWAAGCGCDAAPYFRVFNPEMQQKKFDPEGKYIQKWVPEYGTSRYANPIVEHAFARDRVLKAYKSVL